MNVFPKIDVRLIIGLLCTILFSSCSALFEPFRRDLSEFLSAKAGESIHEFIYESGGWGELRKKSSKSGGKPRKNENAKFVKKMNERAKSVETPFLFTNSAALQTYAFSFGEHDSLSHYLVYFIDDITKNKKGKQKITYGYERRSVTNNATIGDGEWTITVDQGTMCLAVAPMMNAGEYAQGFSMKIPNTLSVGIPIESSTAKSKAKNGKENTVTYSGFMVEAEDSVAVGKETILCYKIGGVVNGVIHGSLPLESARYNLWVAPGVGLVKAETDYYNMKMQLVKH